MRVASLLAFFAVSSMAFSQGGTRFYEGQARPIDERLFQAIRNGQVETVRALLARGTNPNANEADGWSALSNLGGSAHGQLAIAKLLVAKGAKINPPQSGQCYTPLLSALNGGESPLPLVRYLLLKGANPNAILDDGTTALHLAVVRGDPACVQELLARGARLDARTHDRNTVKSSDPTLDESARGRILSDEERNAHVAEPGFRFSGLQPVHDLATHWNPTVADLLLKAGASLKTTDDNGWTSLHYAVRMGVPAAVEG